MKWVPRMALVGVVVAFALPVSTAQATTTVEQIPYEVTLRGCGPDTITLSGTVLAIFTLQDLRDEGLLLSFHFQWQGVSGTSSSGIPYHLIGPWNQTVVYFPRGGGTTTFVYRFDLVGTMGAPTYYVEDTFHITITPTGDITVWFDKYSEYCP
jgi:hypothetical protein